MTITATPIKDCVSPTGAEQRLYKLSEPVSYGWNDDAGTTDFVIVSAVIAMFSGPETYIFPADADGEVIDWAEMDGSYRGGLDHEQALLNAGWTVAP